MRERLLTGEINVATNLVAWSTPSALRAVAANVQLEIRLL